MGKLTHEVCGDYHALSWPVGCGLCVADVWEAVPELIVGKYLVNTCFDSGFLMLDETMKRDGWRMVGRLAHSPQILDIQQVPHDQFEEWLVFNELTEVDAFESMINSCGLTPLDSPWETEAARFWARVDQLRPAHVIGDNDRLYLLGREPGLIDQLLQADRDGTLRRQRPVR